MGVSYGPSSDQDVINWRQNIIDNGGSVSTSTMAAVLQFTKNLKNNGLWNKLVEIYILCGVNDFNSSLTKLKFLSTQRLSNSGFGAGDFTSTGSTCGLSGDGTNFKSLSTGITINDIPSTNRSVAVYETRRVAAFYTTVIGRDNNGNGNTAFGPTINPDGTISSRMLDTTNSTAIGGSSSLTPGGLLYSGATSSSVGHYSNKTWASSATTLGTYNGTTQYSIGGAIGGGGLMNATVSLGFIGYYLNQQEVELLSSYCDTLMTVFGGNK